jgi:hypothetical protein
VAAIVVSAIPSPEGGLSRSNWNDPTVKAEMKAWSSVFGMEPEPFTDRLYQVAVGYQQALDVVLWPAVRWERLTGTGQSWKMFVAAHRYPSRFRIEARDGADVWTLLFEERNHDAAWMATPLGVERLRASIFRWSWPQYAKHGRRACATLALRAFAEDASRTEVRCRFLTARSPSADEVRSGRIPEGTSKTIGSYTPEAAARLVDAR